MDSSVPWPAPLPQQFYGHQHERCSVQGEVEDVQGANQGALDQEAQFLDQMGLGRDRRNRHPCRHHQQQSPRKAVEPVQQYGNPPLLLPGGWHDAVTRVS